MNRFILPALVLLGLLLKPALAEEVRLQHDGLDLNARLEKADENWPQGPVMLITHGTLAHNGMEIITTLQKLLKENGYSSLAINLSLGLDDRHGMYDCATPHTHRHTDALTEIGLWLGWLRGQGTKEIVLVGHSRGGNQTAWFAATHDDPAIEAMVLIAPQTWSEAYAEKDYEKRYGRSLAPILKEAQDLVASGRPDAWLQHTGFIYCPDAKVSARSFVSYHAPDPRMDTPTLLAEIDKPVLVFAGTEDQVVKGLDRRMAPLADSEKIEFVVIEGADHMFRDLYAEDLVDAMTEFVEPS